MKPTDFAYHLSTYLSKYLPSVAGLRQNTIISYRDTFTALIQFYDTELGIKPERLTLDVFTAERIRLFLAWLEEKRGNSAATRNNRLAAIHAFAKYVERNCPEKMHSMQEIITVPVKKTAVKVPVYLPLDALQFLLSLPDTSRKTGRRDCVLLSLLYDSGARVQELCDVLVSDVRLDNPGTIKLTGKGQKTRIVPLMPPMLSLLRQYFDEHGLGDPARALQPLFLNHCGSKLTRKGVSHILNKYFLNAKDLQPSLFPETFSPHGLRHSKSMHLLQSGVNLVYIRDILGHADIKTTEVYARIDTEMKRKALEAVSVGIVGETAPIWQTDKGLLDWLKSLG